MASLNLIYVSSRRYLDVELAAAISPTGSSCMQYYLRRLDSLRADRRQLEESIPILIGLLKGTSDSDFLVKVSDDLYNFSILSPIGPFQRRSFKH